MADPEIRPSYRTPCSLSCRICRQSLVIQKYMSDDQSHHVSKSSSLPAKLYRKVIITSTQ